MNLEAYGNFYLAGAIFTLALVLAALPTLFKGPRDKDDKQK
ncbi:MAG: hypothetical protein UX73_C0016G0004 [candidate division WWE3 bacterium GW2011_GWC1_47_10]|uniref:Uncharacterized protein n=1 Tax=candidate division WWE3 bacterium GW2011_GWC1_47_10 TaxID=1619122 RepID=A0A0G1TZ88_UNCKA|nr:MAG: hypothetical protein UX73_C0016G0004 [candidate division WWE3 bacterium GW2011_GWC1_47_10]